MPQSHRFVIRFCAAASIAAFARQAGTGKYATRIDRFMALPLQAGHGDAENCPESSSFPRSSPEYPLLAGAYIGSNSREEGAEGPMTVANREINQCHR